MSNRKYEYEEDELDETEELMDWSKNIYKKRCETYFKNGLVDFRTKELLLDYEEKSYQDFLLAHRNRH